MEDIKETVVIEGKVQGQKDVENLGKAIKDNKKATESLEKSTDNLGKEVKKNTNESTKGFQRLKGAVSAVGNGFKALGTAIKLAGIGLVIGAVVKLTEAFSKNQQIMDAVSKIFNTINIVFGEVVNALVDAFNSANKATGGFDALGKVLGGILTLILTPFKVSFFQIKLAIQAAQLAWEKSPFGDKDQNTIKQLNEDIQETKKTLFEIGVEAVNAGKDIVNNTVEAFSEIGEFATTAVNNVKKISIEAASATANNLVALRNEVQLAESQLAGLTLEFQRQAEVQRQIRDDVSLSIEERIQANEKLGAILEQQAQEELALANKKVSLAQLELSLNKGNIEARVALQEALNGVTDINERITGQQSEQIVNEKALQDERRANLQELRQLGLEEQERRILESEIELENQLQLIERTVANEQEKNRLIEAAELDHKQRLDAIRQDELNKIKEKEAAEAKIQEAKLQAQRNREKEIQGLITDGLGAVAESAGLGKEFAIAKTLFDTFQSARAAFSSQLIPGDPTSLPRAIGAAAFSAVSGLADVAAIRAVQVPQVSGGGGGVGGGGSQPQPPTPPSFNLVGASGASAITQPLIENETPPVQAFVVSKNVTTAQQLDNNAVIQSTF